MLELKDVTFAYSAELAYRFSLTAVAGEVTAVTGASGSGKSTLLDLIAGFLTPSGGAIRLDARDLIALPPERRPISILFQSETVFEHLSANANVALGLPEGTPRQEAARQTAAALDEVGLGNIGARRAAQLSGGQKQRVALARTLLRARPILLLDEPFSALDDETRGAARDLVLALTRRHDWYTVLVSHSAEDIGAMADRRYHLENGELTPR